MCFVLLSLAPDATAEDSVAGLTARAKALIEKEDFDAAQKLLAKAEQISPDDIDVLYQRGYAFYRQRDLPAAKRRFSTVVKLAPPALYSRYFLGRIALLEGHASDAARWLEPPAAANPPVFDANAQLAKAWLEAGEPGKAREIAQRALQQAPWDGSIHYLLGRIDQKLGRPELAKEEFATSQRLKAADQTFVSRVLECSRHLERGEKEEALRISRELTGDRQLDPAALIALGVVLGNAGLQAEAVQVFRTAADREPGLFQAQYNLGVALMKSGRAAEARIALEEAVRLLPQSPDANISLAVADVLAGRYAEAIPVLETVRRLLPGNLRAATLLGLAYLRTGAPKQAVPVVRDALKLPAGAGQGDLNLHLLLVEALGAADDPAGALLGAQEAARLFPNEEKAQLCLAQQLAVTGKYQEAGPVFRRALELAATDVHALLGLADVQVRNGEYQEALATYRRAAELDKSDAAAQVGIAKSLISLTRLADAREVLENAVSAHPDDYQIRLELSRVYARLGDKQRAAEQARVMQQLRQRESSR